MIDLNENELYALIGGCVLGLAVLIVFTCWVRQKLAPFLTSHTRTPYSSAVCKGRRAAVGHTNMAVFLIGMKINRWYRFDLWIPTLLAMGTMLDELHQHDKEFGYYGGETYGILALLFGYPSLQVTYWESMDHVLMYSSSKTHNQSMQKYMMAMNKAKGAVGVWHELYEVNRVEGMHRDMPSFGLVRAVGSLSAEGELNRAQNRLNQCPFSRTEMSDKLTPQGQSKSCPFSSKYEESVV